LRSERKRLKFYRTPAPLTWLYPSLTWRMPAESKEVYLTFDDGPVPGPTEFVLDVLRDNAIKGTFFCIGQNIEKHPQILRHIMEEGHSIGNHTFNHLNGWNVSAEEYIANVMACGSLIDSASRIFRPPYGRISRKAIRMLKDYQIVMWDVLSYDFSSKISPAQCLQGALAAVRPGSIVVFHDSYKAEKNLTFALPRFIDECRKRGLAFAPLRGRSSIQL
jgi:peptidoglycan/xylan/chitin deacetylase (PgdA/CDA1 family)